MMNALKEWATVVNALENGDQTVLLRKGGILEDSSGFVVESEKFFLFPTFEHQEKIHVKPQFHKHLEDALKNKPKDGFNNITSFAHVLYEKDIDSEDKINALSPFHILSDSYVKERIDWLPEKSMKALFLRTYKVPEFETPIKSEYHGCKSWIELNEKEQDTKSVLNDEEIESRMKEFKEIVN